MPLASGMLASVEERSMRDWLLTYSSAARNAARRGEFAESSPPGRVPRTSIFQSSLPFERSRGGFHFVADAGGDGFVECGFELDDFVFAFGANVDLEFGVVGDGVDGGAAFDLAEIKGGARGRRELLC